MIHGARDPAEHLHGCKLNVPSYTTAELLCFTPHHQSLDNPVIRIKWGFNSNNRFYTGLCFVAVCVVRARWRGCPEWGGSRVRIVCPFTPLSCVPVGEKASAVLPLCFARDIAALFLRCCRPLAATTTASTHCCSPQQQYAPTLSHLSTTKLSLWTR